MENNLNWMNWYMEFADKLKEFKHDRNTLIERMMSAYETTGLDVPKLEKDKQLVDIDPFTIFGIFNKGLKWSNKELIIEAFSREFGVTSEMPDNFDAIPIVNNLSATFYHFLGDRGEHDIDNIWELFDVALKLADGDDSVKNDFIHFYDIVKDQKGIKWNLTMALFWIRPFYFLSLDATNRTYIKDKNGFGLEKLSFFSQKTYIQDGTSYLELCEEIRNYLKTNDREFNSIVELSRVAYLYEPVKIIEDDILGGSEKKRQYWLYSAGSMSVHWDEFKDEGIMALHLLGLEDFRTFKNQSEIRDRIIEVTGVEASHKNRALAAWQFCKEMQIGDIVYVKKGKKHLIGRGIVTSEYKYDENNPVGFNHIRDVNWTHEGLWDHSGNAVVKTLTNITSYPNYADRLEKMIVGAEEIEFNPEVEISYVKYTKDHFLNEVYLSEAEYDTLRQLLKVKKNLILQGAPGVGKTFLAKRLAYSIMGEKDYNRVLMVQFHQSYSYEDFIMGFRPDKDGFTIKEGVFYNFCKKAGEDLENPYYFIIDEINRGNLSKIFGELFMLLENDKRGVKLGLLYRDEEFSIPKNVHIIGMMNTADRSLAMMDYALRRRFSFFEIKPGINSKGFDDYRKALDDSKFNKLLDVVNELNEAISIDESLGSGFMIGHSYFCNLDKEKGYNLKHIVEYEIVPLLKEYWFDEPNKALNWAETLRGSIE